jgi:hypothetical protein
MKIPNSSRVNTENDSLSSNFNSSDMKNDLFLFNKNINNKTEQIRLKRNLLQSKYPIQNNDRTSSMNETSENSLIAKEPEVPKVKLIDFKEAYNYFKSIICPNGINNQKNNNCCSCSSEKIKKEKLFILSLSRIRYDKNNDIHFRILFSIYYFFTKKNCEKEGEHWQDIGFQSDSPSPDLISVGMCGPLQILYGINKYPLLYTELFNYLLQRKCDLYYMVNLLSMCKFSLNMLERNLLDDIVKDKHDLFIVLNELYVGMGYEYKYEINNYGNNNILTIEYIVKTLKNISEMRTQINQFINNHNNNLSLKIS